MKKVFAISFAFLVLLSGMHFSIAQHYCSGELAATRVSLSGELASCGMEGDESSCPVQDNGLKAHCCDDTIASYAVDNNYNPSFSEAKDVIRSLIQEFYVPESFVIHAFITQNSLFADDGPPGPLSASAVSLADICVFRI
jgi:hypothetical protein